MPRTQSISKLHCQGLSKSLCCWKFSFQSLKASSTSGHLKPWHKYSFKLLLAFSFLAMSCGMLSLRKWLHVASILPLKRPPDWMRHTEWGSSSAISAARAIFLHCTCGEENGTTISQDGLICCQCNVNFKQWSLIWSSHLALGVYSQLGAPQIVPCSLKAKLNSVLIWMGCCIVRCDLFKRCELIQMSCTLDLAMRAWNAFNFWIYFLIAVKCSQLVQTEQQWQTKQKLQWKSWRCRWMLPD